MVSYEEVLPIGAIILISVSSFFIGYSFANFPYDYYTLWDTSKGEEYFKIALDHYKFVGAQPRVIEIALAVIAFIGIVGCAIRIFKPSEDTKYFEYGSLGAYVIAICIYLTNVRNGELSAIAGQWGDVDENTGVAVISASQVLIIMILFAVILLQSGLFYAEYLDYQEKNKFYQKELGETYNETLKNAEAKRVEAVAETASTSGAAPAATKTTKKTKPKSKKKA